MTEAQLANDEALAEKLAQENAVLTEAAEALRHHEEITKALRASEAKLRNLCRQYDKVSGATGFAPHHLRNECIIRGLLT